MAEASDVRQRFESYLEPFVKPREQVNFIRRVLALHIGYSAQDGPIKRPLALPDATIDAASSKDDATASIEGVRGEYIAALRANVAASRRLDEATQVRLDVETPPKESGTNANSSFLEGRIQAARLHKKRERLLVVERALDAVAQERATTHNALLPDDIFHGVASLPSVPELVVNGLGPDHGATSASTIDAAAGIGKTLLKAQVLLKREENRLRDARAQSQQSSDALSDAARLDALEATRNALIEWIEQELSKAPADSSMMEADEPQASQAHGQRLDQAGMAIQLEGISNKYKEYLAVRGALLALVAHQPQTTPQKPTLPPPVDPSISAEQPTGNTTALLPTPCLERLLAISKRQKETIALKSHVKSTLAGQNRTSCDALGRLAEKSELLHAYPLKESLRRRSGLWDELTSGSSERPDTSTRIRPWVFAADSAKMATLEAVAETIGTGQEALEKSMRTIQEIDRLLGKQPSSQTPGAEAGEDEDVWLQPGKSQIPVRAKKQTGKKTAPLEDGDIWSVLHGNLGLIGQEDAL